MKRRLISFIVLLVAISLCACSNGKSRVEQEQNNSDKVNSNSSLLETSDSKSGVMLNGVSLKNYTIVYGVDDVYAKFAAEILKDHMASDFNVIIAVTADNRKTNEYEIVIGNTNRGLTIENEERLSKNEYALCAVDTKIVLKANGYMIGGAVREFLDICEATPYSDNKRNVTIGKSAIVKTYEYETPKNVLLYIGDGMGFNHIEWAKSEGMTKFYAEDMPNKGQAVTYSHSVTKGDASYTDSAAAGTALATGYKTMNGYIGIDKNGEQKQNVRELAATKGAKTAVLTSDEITGATPAAFLAHVQDRGMTTEIQNEVDALLLSQNVTVAKGALGNLLNNSKRTLRTISSGDDGFFMMLEEGYIDKHSHSKNEVKMIERVKHFNDTIAYAMEFTLISGDTILIVTADHETGGVTNNNGFVFTTDQHTNQNVPLYAMGKGTESLVSGPLNNVLIPRFIATVFGDNSFGDMSITQ